MNKPSTNHNEPPIAELAYAIGQKLLKFGWKLTVAESCTGGWIAKSLTDIPGSSAWLEYGFVTYSNTAKHSLLGVPNNTLEQHGAVSAATVSAMAQGAIIHSNANVAIAVSGIAGPTGGTPDKPLGTVWLAWYLPKHKIHTECQHFTGNRKLIRQQAVHYALQELRSMLENLTSIDPL